MNTAMHYLQQLLGIQVSDAQLWDDLRRFEGMLMPAITEIWDLNQVNYRQYWKITNPHTDEDRQVQQMRIQQTIERLEAEEAELTKTGAVAMLLNPQLWQFAYQNRGYDSKERFQIELAPRVMETIIQRQAPRDWTKHVAQRMLTLCSATISGYAPNLVDCVEWLLEARTPMVDQTLLALLECRWNDAWRALNELSQTDLPPQLEKLAQLWLDHPSPPLIMQLLRLAWEQDRFSSELFTNTMETYPNALSYATEFVAPNSADDALTVEFKQVVNREVDSAIWTLLDLLQAGSGETWRSIQRIAGGHFLIRLLELAQQHQVTMLKTSYYAKNVSEILGYLVQILHRSPDDDFDTLVSTLRRFDPALLLMFLPVATQYRAELLTALEWDGSAQLLQLLETLQNQSSSYEQTNPSNGTLNRADVLTLQANMDAEQWQQCLQAFAPYFPQALLLFNAVLGVQRKEIRQMFGRRNQWAVRAFGLLPLEKPNELLDRYTLFQRFLRETNSRPAGRKATERAAVQAGLTNLAWNAGFSDATRLEWAMEDQIGTQQTSLGRTWEIESYTLTLVFRDGKPRLAVQKGAKSLKRVPVLVRREYEFKEVQATLDAANDQIRRYKQTFSNVMRNDEVLSADEINLLRRNPLAVVLLEQLILLDEAGACGLYHADDHSLEGTHGERVPVTGSIRIAHPYILEQHGWLSDWQTELVRRQIVQPFKQVFRELYVLTPAELTAQYASARLAGRRIKTRQASAVLANLGWSVSSYEMRKPFHHLGFVARFELEYVYDQTDEPSSMTRNLEFRYLKYDPERQEQRLELSVIPPIILAEILRDIDLVTTVAHNAEEDGTSREILQRRGDLVRSTCAAIGLANVRVDERHVHVQGSLTSYRIHLATGAIYMANGQYLCIVPSKNQQSSVFLPFAEASDNVMSEIISKTLLLANDMLINDGTIRAQISVA